MQDKFERNLSLIIWMSLGCSLGLWIACISRTKFSDLSFNPPFANLNMTFWVGLIVVLCVFFMGNGIQKAAALVVMSFYFIATLSFIYDYPVMHDSLNNVADLAVLGQIGGTYGRSYVGFPIFITWIRNISGADSLTLARFFPVGMSLIYLLTLGLIGVLWRKFILTSTLSSLFFAFFIIVFGETFYLRINASPQTVAFFLFLIALGVMPLSTRSLLGKFFLLVTLFAIIFTHPTTPLLAVPGLVAVGFFSGKIEKKNLLLAFQTAGVFLVGYLIWTLYQAGWILSSAFKFVLDAFETEKIIPIVGYTYTAQPDLDNYLFWHRILLIALITFLGIAYFVLIGSKTWRFVTAWGISMLPPFVVLFSYRDFFDRVLLFSLIPCALIFAEATTKIFFRIPKLKIPVSIILILLTLLSAYISYFVIGSVDRITVDEIKAVEFLETLNTPLSIYAGGFNFPMESGNKYVSEHRGEINLNQVAKADAIIVSQQMENSVFLNPRQAMKVPELVEFLQQDYYEAYSTDHVHVFLRKP